jgi:hypothetical protein
MKLLLIRIGVVRERVIADWIVSDRLPGFDAMAITQAGSADLKNKHLLCRVSTESFSEGSRWKPW